MRLSIAVFTLTAVLVACGSNSTGSSDANEFIVKASGSSTAAASLRDGLPVDPSSFRVGFLEMRLSANADCSGPFQTVFSRATPNILEMLTNPEVARTDGLPVGTYNCAAIRVSDLLHYVPATTEAPCTAGVTYERDVYRAEEEDLYKDPSGATIVARGTQADPVEDFIWVFASTNQSAAEGSGYTPNQVLPLSSALVVPGATTFYWDLHGALGAESPDSPECGTVGGSLGFR